MRMLLRAALSVLAVTVLARAEPVNRAQAISDAITELDVSRAKQLLSEADGDSATLSFERARLAVYMGDCDTASAILAAPAFASTPEGASLGELAKSCARATAGSLVIDDSGRGVWIRLQEERDRALVPFIVDVADRARKAIEKDLGVTLPRPLRIDLVRDLFSLSAVSGLPVNAAENTGTVAVARWGRITMITPRATQLGYPWEDTLAHEITHLALSRATRDRAPLWLQEGIAKLEETRWRSERPFDDAFAYDAIARRAYATGRSVGVDKLGPSIAMLPTPEAASTAFAEVTSFMSYWIREHGEPALQLLLADLRGTGAESADQAMVSVTGYPLAYWLRRWQKEFDEPVPKQDDKPKASHPPKLEPTDLSDIARRVRLSDLLFARGHGAGAANEIEAAAKLVDSEPALRFRLSRARLANGDVEAARAAHGTLVDIGAGHGGWFALSGRFQRDGAPRAEAERSFRLGIALDPLSEEVACEGHWVPRKVGPERPPPPPLPKDPARRALCQAAIEIPRE